MPAHDDVVGNHHAIANIAIMRDMHHRHQQAVRTDFGNAGASDSAAMDRTMFAYLRARADAGLGLLAIILEILRRQTNCAKGEQFGPGANARLTIHGDVGDQFSAILQHHLMADSAKRTNFHARADHGTLSDNGGGVDHLMHRL